MAKANLLALDKTGTITEGNPRVVSFEIKDGFDERVLYKLIETSTHPISQGIKRFMEQKYKNTNIRDINLEDIKIYKGNRG